MFSYPLAFDAPVRGFRRNSAIPFGVEKLEWLGYPMVKKFRRYLYSFRRNSRTCQTDRQTDGRTYGRTDRHGMPAIAALMHSIARQKSHEKSPLIGRVDGTATVGDLGSNKHARTTWIT